MAIRSRGVKTEYADEVNTEGVATQAEMEQAFADHIKNDHNPENIYMPEPTDENQILKSYIDEDDGSINWKIVKADDPQEGLTVIALPYYWEDARQKYLGNEVVRVINYIDNDGCEDEYMYYIPGIRNCVRSYNIYEGEKYCIVGIEYSSENAKSGNIIELRTITGKTESFFGTTYEYDTLYVLNLGADEVTELYLDNLDITIDNTIKLSSYILADSDVDKPAITILLRRIWEEEDDS